MKLARTLLLIAFALPLLAQDAPEAWSVDKNHSTATFEVLPGALPVWAPAPDRPETP